MPCSDHAVLVAVVGFAASDRPATPGTIAAALDRPESAVRDCLATLERGALVARTDAGYRPTVTGRELLDAGLDVDDVVVLDPVEERTDEA